MTDITEHEWSDEEISAEEIGDDTIWIWAVNGNAGISLNKEDAMAIAKHFNLFDEHLVSDDVIADIEKDLNEFGNNRGEG